MTKEDKHATLKPGVVLAGKFRIERVLGQGGMGVVVAAHHLQLDERVALKFLLPEALDNAEAVARFAREARAAVKIKSEHVARVTDVGTLDNGSPYMVMEYLNGTDLGDLVKSQGQLPVRDAVEFVLQACEAVAEAHAIGIVHRDLKPSNLFLIRRADGSACVKVLDFGISKLTTGADSQMAMTKTAMVMGSPLYMSPEQMASARDVDARTDIWAIGAILHELVTGNVPFIADAMPQLCHKILQEPPVLLSQARPDAPLGLQEVVLRCLRKKPEDRYPTVAELAADLLPYAPKVGRLSVERITRVISAAGLTASVSFPSSMPPPPASISSAATLAAGITQQAWGASQTSNRSNTRLFMVLGAATVLVGGAAALVFGLSSDPPTGPPVAGVAPSAQATPPVVERKPTTTVPAAPVDASAVPGSTASADPEPTAKLPPAVPPSDAAKAHSARPKHGVRITPRPPEAVTPVNDAPPQLPAVDLYQDRE